MRGKEAFLRNALCDGKVYFAIGTTISRIVEESDVAESMLSIPGTSLESSEELDKAMQVNYSGSNPVMASTKTDSGNPGMVTLTVERASNSTNPKKSNF